MDSVPTQRQTAAMWYSDVDGSWVRSRVLDCNEETTTFLERRYCPHERRRDLHSDGTTTPVVFSGYVVKNSCQLERSGMPASKPKLPRSWSQMAK
ncbi:hypothetical protein EVAR_56235_1 [Eumeta japonica]|uniref:Uncharacterized protein n=1 Tax=Eumeta variegata TaxID=151549 RepID=A0A4C1XKC4_EUMVA|nr:hypothetical protein EVAR_56235_1 [Eumeta japonica]